MVGAVGNGGAAAPTQPVSQDSFRKRQRKPVRGPSSSMLQALDSSLFGSLLKGSGLSGLKEKSGDNAGADVVSSGHAPSNGAAVSGEDDSDPTAQEVKQEVGGGRVSGGGGGDGAGEEAAGVMAEEAAGNVGDEAGEIVPEEEETEPEDGGMGEGGMMGGMMEGGYNPMAARRVRHVPRQSSAANLNVRAGPAEVKRMVAELDSLRAENRRLKAGAADVAGPSMAQRLLQLEEEVIMLRQQARELAQVRLIDQITGQGLGLGGGCNLHFSLHPAFLAFSAA